MPIVVVVVVRVVLRVVMMCEKSLVRPWCTTTGSSAERQHAAQPVEPVEPVTSQASKPSRSPGVMKRLEGCGAPYYPRFNLPRPSSNCCQYNTSRWVLHKAAVIQTTFTLQQFLSSTSTNSLQQSSLIPSPITCIYLHSRRTNLEGKAETKVR